MDRFDRQGLWWSDALPAATRGSGLPRERSIRNVAPPATGWEPPKEFPNLSGVTLLGLDTETKDLELLERGPGAVRGAAHVVGVSVAADDTAWYFPLRHEYEPERGMNQDPATVFEWLSDVLKDPKVSVVGANLMYDLENLRAEDVKVAGPLYDVQFAEPLLNEEAYSYELDVLAKQYLGTGKDTPLLYKWIEESFGNKKEPRADIWRSPPSLTGPYAESDALLPLQILQKQQIKLQSEELTDLFRLECELIPLLLEMRFRGVPIDQDRAAQAAVWLRQQVQLAQVKIPHIDVWSNASLAAAFDKEKIEYTRTEAGNPSFTKLYLESVAELHPLARSVLDVRLYEKAANPFVENFLIGNMHKGRVHCQFHPLRSRDFGTVSGRFSCSNPNLQQIPVRHKVIGPLLRGLFIPERGCRWRKQDYNQVEYRGLAHYAVGRRSDEIRERYNKDRETDFHQTTITMVDEYTGIVLDRRPAKNINFGLTYRMGEDKLIRSLGVSMDMGKRLYSAYHQAMPFVNATAKGAERLAKRRGYIKTILKRRRRFKDPEKAYSALNALLQGTAADIIKKGMRDMWKAGLCDERVIGVPHLQVHDELDWSDPDTPESKEAFKEVEHILETCVPLRVPLLVDVAIGENWGALEKDEH